MPNIKNILTTSIVVAATIASNQGAAAQYNSDYSWSSSTSYSKSWSSNGTLSSGHVYGTGDKPNKPAYQGEFDFQVNNVPLISVLELLEKSLDENILIDRQIMDDANIDLNQPIKAKSSETNIEKLLATFLPAELRVLRDDQHLIITSATKMKAIDKFRLTKASELAGQIVLNKVMPVHFEQAPIEMVVQMVAGMANLQTDIGKGSVRNYFTAPKLVTIHADDQTLHESLDQVLRSVDMEFSVTSGKILVSERMK